VVEETPASLRSETDEEIDIAVRPKVGPEDRPEDRELDDPPTPAEILNLPERPGERSRE
jgi:hypothetical protein